MTGFCIFVDMGWENLDWRSAGQALPQGSIPIYAENQDDGTAVNLIVSCVEDTDFDRILGEARMENALWNQCELRCEDASLFVAAEFEFGQTGFHRLAEFGNYLHDGDIVAAMVAAGGDVNAVNSGGRTPLDVIVFHGWGKSMICAQFEHNGAKTSIQLDEELDAQG